MPRLHIDFASGPVHILRHGRVLGVILGAGVIAVVLNYYHLSQKVVQSEMMALHVIEVERTRIASSGADDAQSKGVAAEVTEIVNQLETPWADFFDLLQQSIFPGIAILEIKPDTKSGLVHIRARADSYQDMLHFLTRVKESSRISDVQLLSHENSSDASSRVDFSLQGRWKLRPS